GRDRVADVLPEGHEQVVVAYPVPSRQAGAQRGLSFSGVPGLDVSQAVRDAVDVDVHTDARLVEALGDHEVRRLSPHALQREEGVDLVRHAAVEARQEIAADSEDDPRLGPVEADGKDGALDPPG